MVISQWGKGMAFFDKKLFKNPLNWNIDISTYT